MASRAHSLVLLAATAALGAWPAHADPRGLSREVPGYRAPSGDPISVDRTRRSLDRTVRHGERSDVESRIELRRQSRDAEVRSDGRRVVERGDQAELVRLRRRAVQREASDRRELLGEVDRILSRSDLGPATRRVFSRQRAELVSERRSAEVDRDLGVLESDLRRREDAENPPSLSD